MNSCRLCGKDTKNKSFCSNSCSRENNRQIVASRPKKKHSAVCLRCKEVFHPKYKIAVFCSHSCSAKHNNLSRRKELKDCLVCAKAHRGKTDFCSVSCRREDFIMKWLDNTVDGGGKYTTSSIIRDFLIKESGYRCPECGENRVRSDGSCVLQIDHINGNWQDNSRGNLRVLCPTCHALTDNYGARNMGNGRKWKKSYSQF